MYVAYSPKNSRSRNSGEITIIILTIIGVFGHSAVVCRAFVFFFVIFCVLLTVCVVVFFSVTFY